MLPSNQIRAFQGSFHAHCLHDVSKSAHEPLIPLGSPLKCSHSEWLLGDALFLFCQNVHNIFTHVSKPISNPVLVLYLSILDAHLSFCRSFLVISCLVEFVRVASSVRVHGYSVSWVPSYSKLLMVIGMILKGLLGWV